MKPLRQSLSESVSSLFGWQIKRPDTEENLQTFAPKIEDDGAVVTAPGGAYGTFVDLDGTVRTEAELVNKYREMAGHPEIDAAVEQICNESIITEDGEKTVEILLDDMPLDKTRKKILEQEFENVLKLLEFNTRSYQVFERWYIDGRLYFHAIIDDKVPNEGIKELRYLDPRKIRKMKEVAKKRDKQNPLIAVPKTTAEYYVYSERNLSTGNKSIVSQSSTSGIRIAKDSIVHVTSGLMDSENKLVLSYLHKAIKPLNQLRALEDATVIARISRAPERRIFYVDVGNLPKLKADQYVADLMRRYKNKLVYDSKTGEIRDDRKFMTMLEDYWLPRREGGKGTEIDTLPGLMNQGALDDVQYFQRKLYKSVNVPVSRLEPEETYNVGRSSEISRDEITFSRFIDRLRLKFTDLFLKVMERNLILKGFCTPEEWDSIKGEIKFRFQRDNLFDELKDAEIMNQRANLLQLMEPYAGRYFSHKWIRTKILRQTEEDIEENDQEIADEMTNPQFAPPIDDVAGGE